MRNTRSLTLIATLLVVVTLFALGCNSTPHSTVQGVVVYKSVIADVLGDCDGAASADELGQVQSYFSQHGIGWFMGVFPFTMEESDKSEISAEVLGELFGEYRLYGSYESETDLRNAYQGVGIDTPYVGIYVIEKDAGYTITHLYRSGGDHVYDGNWKEIEII
jgi:hypothetical protein